MWWYWFKNKCVKNKSKLVFVGLLVTYTWNDKIRVLKYALFLDDDAWTRLQLKCCMLLDYEKKSWHVCFVYLDDAWINNIRLEMFYS